MPDDSMLINSIQTTQMHSDALGEWVVVDDGPSYAEVTTVPVAWEHRQVVSRSDAAERFPAVDVWSQELAAMRRASEALGQLDDLTRVRALRWLVAHFGADAPVRASLPPVPEHTEGQRRWLHEMWIADVPVQQVADALGVEIPTVTARVSRMRRAGWDMPHRRRRPHGG